METLTGCGFWLFQKSFFEGNNCPPEFISGSFQRGINSKIFDKIPKYQMLKQLCIQAHSSSLRCGGSLCKVQHDKLYNASHCKSKKGAFTLAEVLITLAIIGIIAALTIPNLLQKYQEQTTVKKVQKFYSNLSNAYSVATRDNGPLEDWGLTGTDSTSAKKIYEIFLKPYFKISKVCGNYNTGNCFSNSLKGLNGTSAGNVADNYTIYKVVLDDGSAVGMYVNIIASITHIYVVYDINGKKGPNQWGKDLFSFVTRSDMQRVIPSGFDPDKERIYANFNAYCKKSYEGAYSGTGCTAWVIFRNNMDYLHCDGLTWKSRSCKEK